MLLKAKKFIGFIMGMEKKNPDVLYDTKPYSFVTDLAVTKPYRRKGAGKRLVQEMKKMDERSRLPKS